MIPIEDEKILPSGENKLMIRSISSPHEAGGFE